MVCGRYCVHSTFMNKILVSHFSLAFQHCRTIYCSSDFTHYADRGMGLWLGRSLLVVEAAGEPHATHPRRLMMARAFSIRWLLTVFCWHCIFSSQPNEHFHYSAIEHRLAVLLCEPQTSRVITSHSHAKKAARAQL